MSPDEILEPHLARLLDAVGALRTAAAPDLERAVVRTRRAVEAVVETLGTGSLPDDPDAVDPLIAAAALLAHEGFEEIARELLEPFAQAGTPAAARANLALAAVAARSGDWSEVELLLLRTESPLPVAAGLAMCAVYGQADPDHYRRVADLGLAAFDAAPTLRFSVAATMFDRAMLLGDLPAARELLAELESAALAASDELGDDHPRLVPVLLTLTTRQCTHSAAIRAIEKLRRATDILAVAVQRAASLLGPDHVRTLGALAALVLAEFDLALLGGSAADVRRGTEDLIHLDARLTSGLGRDHALTIAARTTGAMARWQAARDAGTLADQRCAALELRHTEAACASRFGPRHPRTVLTAAHAAAASLDLARALASASDLTTAAAHLAATTRLAREVFGSDHPLTASLRALNVPAADEHLPRVVDLGRRRAGDRRPRWSLLTGAAAATVAIALAAGLTNAGSNVTAGAPPIYVTSPTATPDENPLSTALPPPRSSTETATPATAPSAGHPATGAERTALSMLTEQVDEDRREAETLVGRWVAQVSSKTVGLVVDGVTYDYTSIWKNYLAELSRNPEALLLNSSDFTSFELDDYWVIVLPTMFPSAADTNAWCAGQGFPPRDCFAKRLSHTGNSQANTVLRN